MRRPLNHNVAGDEETLIISPGTTCHESRVLHLLSHTRNTEFYCIDPWSRTTPMLHMDHMGHPNFSKWMNDVENRRERAHLASAARGTSIFPPLSPKAMRAQSKADAYSLEGVHV
jgi:hypothetical protein